MVKGEGLHRENLKVVEGKVTTMRFDLDRYGRHFASTQ